MILSGITKALQSLLLLTIPILVLMKHCLLLWLTLTITATIMVIPKPAHTSQAINNLPNTLSMLCLNMGH